MNSGERPRRLSADRVRWTLIAAAGVVLAATSWPLGDWYLQHRALSSLGVQSPHSRVTFHYENRFFDKYHADRWRYEYGIGGLLPFDRPAWLSASGPFESGYVSRLIAFFGDFGRPQRLYLWIEGGDVSDVDLRRIATFEELTALSISRHHATSDRPGCSEAGCSALFGLPRLGKIHVAGLPVGDGAVRSLVATAGPGLHDISISGSQVSDAGLAELATLPGLRRLDLRSSRASREGAWAFRLSRPEVTFGGPNVPSHVTLEEFQTYRKQHERLRRRWQTSAGYVAQPNDTGR